MEAQKGIQGVLIESDWNLKHLKLPHVSISGKCINRIRLEFKVSDDMQ